MNRSSHATSLGVAAVVIALLSGFARPALAPGPDPAAADPDPVAQASAALVEFDAACRRVPPLWPVELCGPIVLVDPQTRLAVANAPDPAGAFTGRGGVFVGRMPDDMPVANTGFDWQDARWAMIMLPLAGEASSRLRLLAHESFHRIQSALGYPLADAVLAHLDEEQGRTWLRLELRALARALSAAGGEARQAVHDAALFRQVRHATYPGAAELERQLEANEGLAEYTGVRFAMDAAGSGIGDAVRAAEAFEQRPAYVRSLGYGTGPLLGLLLDRYEPGWRDTFLENPDLAGRLAAAVDAPAADPAAAKAEATRRAAGYGAVTVLAEERERARRRAAEQQRYRRILVDGPTLALGPPDLMLMFNPNTVLPLGPEGYIYPGAILLGPWGRLEIREGAALGSEDRSRARVAAPSSAEPAPSGTVEGPGWTLTLEPGWRLVPGERPGDFKLGHAPERPPDGEP